MSGTDSTGHLLPELRPSLWRRYVDDCFEKTKCGTTDFFTEHLNQVDPTGNIKVTVEEELNLEGAFLTYA